MASDSGPSPARRKTPAGGLERARAFVVRALSRRDYSRRGLADKLRGKGFDPAEIRSVLHEAERGGLLDDRRSAERCAEVFVRVRGFAPARIKRELARKGISSDIAGEVASEIGEDGERAALGRAVERRKGALPFPAVGEEARRKWAAYLQRMGYRSALIAEALRTISREEK